MTEEKRDLQKDLEMCERAKLAHLQVRPHIEPTSEDHGFRDVLHGEQLYVPREDWLQIYIDEKGSRRVVPNSAKQQLQANKAFLEASQAIAAHALHRAIAAEAEIERLRGLLTKADKCIADNCTYACQASEYGVDHCRRCNCSTSYLRDSMQQALKGGSDDAE